MAQKKPTKAQATATELSNAKIKLTEAEEAIEAKETTIGNLSLDLGNAQEIISALEGQIEGIKALVKQAKPYLQSRTVRWTLGITTLFVASILAGFMPWIAAIPCAAYLVLALYMRWITDSPVK